MPDSGPRVVLLARAGTARDRVRSGLVEAGADLVLEADPTGLEPPQLHEARPQLAMVVLDALSEPAFDRLEPVLAELGAEVMLEEAEVAAAREGWDAARWVRHVAAKLHRHGNVLPPGAEAAASDEGPLTAPAMDADGATSAPPGMPTDHAAALDSTAFDLPLDPGLPEIDGAANDGGAMGGGTGIGVFDGAALLDPGMPDAATLDGASPAAGDAMDDGLSFDPALIDLASVVDDGSSAAGDELIVLPFATASADSVTDADAGDGNYLSFDPVAAEAPDAGGAATVIAFDFGLDDGLPLPEVDAPDATVAFDPDMHGDFDFQAPPPAPAPAPELLPAASWEDAPAAVAVAEPVGTSGRFGALELALDDGPIVQTAAPVASDLRHLEDLDRRIASLELVDDTPAGDRAGLHGAVAVLAGIGGPDAVRQLLGALPADFARPVLVQQRLDGARHDRLVAQMQRASALPVELATAAVPVRGGVVYIVPAGVGVARADEGLRFDDSGELLGALEPADSAVVLLSGTELADAERLATAEWAPALRAAQAPEGCYDATAPLALASLGGVSGQPAELARHLIERWSAP